MEVFLHFFFRVSEARRWRIYSVFSCRKLERIRCTVLGRCTVSIYVVHHECGDGVQFPISSTKMDYFHHFVTNVPECSRVTWRPWSIQKAKHFKQYQMNAFWFGFFFFTSSSIVVEFLGKMFIYMNWQDRT